MLIFEKAQESIGNNSTYVIISRYLIYSAEIELTHG